MKEENLMGAEQINPQFNRFAKAIAVLPIGAGVAFELSSIAMEVFDKSGNPETNPAAIAVGVVTFLACAGATVYAHWKLMMPKGFQPIKEHLRAFKPD